MATAKKAAARTTAEADGDSNSPDAPKVGPKETPDAREIDGTAPTGDQLDEILVRNDEPDVDRDGRFHHTFVLPPTGVIAEDNWADSDGAEEIHNASKVALLELALHRGLHPQEEARFDGEATRKDGSRELSYSVLVRPAHDVAHPSAETVAPSSALVAMGGDTLAGKDQEK